MEAFIRPKERLANSGQRGQGCVALERAHIKGNTLSVTQLKTGERVWIPITNELVEALDAWDHAQQVWATKRTAKTKTNPKPRRFQSMFRKWC